MAEVRCPLRECALISQHEPGLATSEGSLTFHEFDQLVTATMLRLHAVGCVPGEHVGFYLDTHWQHVALLLSVIRLGAVACPVSRRLPPDALRACLERIHAVRLVADTDLPDLGIPRVHHVDDLVLLAPGPGGTKDQRIPLERPATIVFTSGSGGRPKAALHTFANHYYSARGANANLRIGSKDRWLLSLPLWHVSGLGIVFRCLASGASIVVPDPGEPIEDAVPRYDITHASMVATQLRRYLDRPPEGSTSLKAVLLGGGPVPADLLARAGRAELPVYVSYGLTEMASQVTTTEPGAAVRKRGTAGPVLRFREMKLAADGEILVRGRTRFAGYVEGDTLEQPFDAEGWYATGDLGRLDEEGHLAVLGRKDNQFVSGGENIQPEEIEALLRALEGVEDALIVPVPDAEFGQRPVAFLRMAEEGAPELDGLADLLGRALPRFKVPDAFFAWPDDLAAPGIKPNRPAFAARAAELRK